MGRKRNFKPAPLRIVDTPNKAPEKQTIYCNHDKNQVRPTVTIKEVKISSGQGSTQDIFNLVSDSETYMEKLMQRANDKESLIIMADEWNRRFDLKMQIRAENFNPSYEEFEILRKSKQLDSTLKKCTSFVKKMKQYSEGQRDSILKDIQTLNLTKYLSEIATALVETKFKVSEISDVITICSMIHVRYCEFNVQLFDNYKKILPTNKKTELNVNHFSKLGMDIRIIAELIIHGILPVEAFGLIIMTFYCINALDKDILQTIIPVLIFLRGVGDEVCGVLPTNVRKLLDQHQIALSRYTVIAPDKMKFFNNLLKDYYSLVGKAVLKCHEEVLSSELLNRKLIKTRGEIPADRRESHGELTTSFDKIMGNVRKLAHLLDRELPHFRSLPPDLEQEEEMALIASEQAFVGQEIIVPGIVIFEDEETRSFYQDYPDLKVHLPPVAYRDTILQVAQQTKEIEEREKEILNLDVASEAAELSKEVEYEGVDTGDEEIEGEDALPSRIEEMAETEVPIKPSYEIYLKSLLNCVTRTMIDKAALEFAENYNNRPNRKKLARCLFHLPRNRVDLIPLWSRLLAILHPVMPDISLDLCATLKNDFRYLVKKKHQVFIETKLKITRFIAELVNFKIFPKSDAFSCFKMLLMDFVHHQIEMACAFVETCGRILHRSPDSHLRMKLYMEEMMRKKSLKAHDPRYINMIDHAYYLVIPPEAGTQTLKTKKRYPLDEYIKLTVVTNMDLYNLEQTLIDIQRLDWKNPQVWTFALKWFTRPWDYCSDQITLLASLVAGITDDYPLLKTMIVDTIVEDIRLGIECYWKQRNNQRRTMTIIYLAELYNYSVMGSSLIFKVLYMLISNGLNDLSEKDELVDPCNNFFRIRLICSLVKTCGEYFNKGSKRNKMNVFLAYLQRYYWFKRDSKIFDQKALPFSVIEIFEECVKYVRPKMPLALSFEQACEVTDAIEKKYLKDHTPTPNVDENGYLTLAVIPLAIKGILFNHSETDVDLIIPSLQNQSPKKKITYVDFNDEERPRRGIPPPWVLEQRKKQKHTLAEKKQQEELQRALEWLKFPHKRILSPYDTSEFPPMGKCTKPRNHNVNRLRIRGSSSCTPCSAGESEAEEEMNTFKVKMAEWEAIAEEEILNTEEPTDSVQQEEEDREFLLELEKLCSETSYPVARDGPKYSKTDIPIPLSIQSSSSIQKGENMMNFTLIQRKGKKQEFKTLQIPVESDFVKTLKQREETERREKERVKQITLGINQLQEEEEQAQFVASTQSNPKKFNYHYE